MTPDTSPEDTPKSIIDPYILSCMTPTEQALVARIPELDQHFLQMCFRILKLSRWEAASHILLFLSQNPPPPPPPPPDTPC